MPGFCPRYAPAQTRPRFTCFARLDCNINFWILQHGCRNFSDFCVAEHSDILIGGFSFSYGREGASFFRKTRRSARQQKTGGRFCASPAFRCVHSPRKALRQLFDERPGDRGDGIPAVGHPDGGHGVDLFGRRFRVRVDAEQEGEERIQEFLPLPLRAP